MLWLVKLLTGTGGIAGELRAAYQAKLNAQNDSERLEAETRIALAKEHVEMAEIAGRYPWSATSLGRYLIVLPFGLWWCMIYIDSTFNLPFDVLAVPQNIYDMALYLVPIIVIGDAGQEVLRKVKRYAR